MSKLPDCMVPDGDEPCAGYKAAEAQVARLKEENHTLTDAIALLEDANNEKRRKYHEILAHISRLRKALDWIASSADDGAQDSLAYQMWPDCVSAAKEALAATPQQSLEAARNGVLEEVGQKLTGMAKNVVFTGFAMHPSPDDVLRKAAEAIRALKGEG